MTGLAASIGAASPASASAIADALAARGPDVASWSAGRSTLVVRAAMPVVHELPGGALLLDGDASPSTLATAYEHRGWRGLVSGRQPYAVILADLHRDALLLARNGDGPPLYWARLGHAVVAASEPLALLAAGVPAAPDPVVIERFIATGACDDRPETFFAGVRRVQPGEVVEVTRDGIRVYEPPSPPVVTAAAALAVADLTGQIGVRLGCDIGSAAVLGAALSLGERPRPLPVYSTTFPELAAADSSAYCAAALLGPYALGAARHRALPFFADEVDVDAYLADLGEPTPELDDWLCWAIARRVAGEVDALVDAAAGSHLSRLADRIATRFGVGLRVPLRHVPEAGRREQLTEFVQRRLPSSAAGLAVAAEAERGPDALLIGLLRRMRAELVTTFLQPRGTAGGLADALKLFAGDRVDVRSLWRRYLVERWLRTIARPAALVRPATSSAGLDLPSALDRPAGSPRSAPSPRVDHGVLLRHAERHAKDPHDRRGRGRTPVRTEVLAAGDKLPEKLAWYVGEATVEPPAGPWSVLLAAKPVAVMQDRARPLWEIEPGLLARALNWLVRGRGGAPRTSWAMQVAIDEGGAGRIAAAAVGAALGHGGWYARIAGPAVCALREPREGAVPPSHVAVVPAPAEPDRVAAEVVAALRTVLPDPAYRLLGGVGVVSARGDVLGWAAGPAGGEPPAIDGDPFGAEEQAPITITIG